MSRENLEKIELIKKHIRSYPDFPKKGVLFRDIFSALLEPQIFSVLRDVLVSYARNTNPQTECIVAVESRGFLLGPIVALELQVPFVPIRKKGKLPGDVISVEYTLEYGEGVLEIQKGSLKKNMNVLVIDDLLATGGSLAASCKLVKDCEANVVSCLVLMELVNLKGASKIPTNVHSILQY